jgi:hypothetical protein
MMPSRKNCLSLIGGVAAFLLVVAPNAFAKNSSSSGIAQVTCGDGLITYTPTLVWPPNQQLTQIDISFAEPQPEPISDTGTETLGLQINSISSNQDTQDAAAAPGCGPETGAGDDWVFSTTPVTGTPDNDTVTVSTTVQLRAERCSKIKTSRVYTIDLTCADADGTTDTASLTVTVPHKLAKF